MKTVLLRSLLVLALGTSLVCRAETQDHSSPPPHDDEGALPPPPWKQDFPEGNAQSPEKPNLTPEQKQQLQEFREHSKDMTPEQRREALSQLPVFKELSAEQRQMVERHMQQGPQGQGGNSPDQEARRRAWRERMEKLTPEQRQQFQDFRQRARDMTPEQRHAEAEKLPFLKELGPPPSQNPQGQAQKGVGGGGNSQDPAMQAKKEQMRREMRARWQKLTPEEKQQIKDFRQHAKEMTPEQRRAEAAKLPFFRDMTPEQKQMMKQRMERFQKMTPEQREKLRQNFEKWKKMSPEEREQFRQRLRERRKSGGEGAPPPHESTAPSRPSAAAPTSSTI